MGLSLASKHHLDELKTLCHAGHLGKAFHTIHLLYQHGSCITSNVFCCFLRCCNDIRHLEVGRALYKLILQHHNLADAYLGSQFIRMFSSCGSLVEAIHVFDRISHPDTFTWTTIISAHVKFRHNQGALALYDRMLQSDVEPDGHLFVAAMKACTTAENLPSARLIHKRMLESCLKPDVVVINALVDMYSKCRSLRDAREAFDSVQTRNVVTWNIMIAGYAQDGHSQEACKLLSRMPDENVAPNGFTFASILKACSGTTSLHEGRLLHTYIIESGCDSDDFLGSSLTDSYCKWGSLEDARKVFDCIKIRCVVTWTSMISGYAQHENGEEAIQLFQKMHQEDIEPNKLTFSSLVKACAVADLACARLVHIGIIRAGFESDMVVGSALVDVYAKQGSIEDAERVFDGLGQKNVVTWSSMIAGYAHSPEHGLKALQCFQQMLAMGIPAVTPTYVSVLRACAGLEAVGYGMLLHVLILEKGFDFHEFVVSSTIDMYAKCQSIEDARNMFHKVRVRDIVIYNAMISGFSLQGCDDDALQLFYEMVRAGLIPDTVTFVSILKSCSNKAALLDGKLVYTYILEQQLEGNLRVGNAIIDMFTTCGCMDDGNCVFNGLQKRDIVSWTSMITGYAQEKNYSLALRYYWDMQEEGWKPDNVTLVSILSACSRESLLSEGCEHFGAMRSKKLTPSDDHFNCMVDLLGNAGHLEEAADLLLCTPSGSDTVGWTSLLGHCNAHHNVEVGRHCFDHVVALDDKKAGAYILMRNLYEQAGMHEDALYVEQLRLSATAWKNPGQAVLEERKMVHDLCVGV
ncbi:hypothetical protein L7F22_058419 [Adiantum nelumboides]|nr:hypothetical protein [Adiantum nelumboides]